MVKNTQQSRRQTRLCASEWITALFSWSSVSRRKRYSKSVAGSDTPTFSFFFFFLSSLPPLQNINLINFFPVYRVSQRSVRKKLQLMSVKGGTWGDSEYDLFRWIWLIPADWNTCISGFAIHLFQVFKRTWNKILLPFPSISLYTVSLGKVCTGEGERIWRCCRSSPVYQDAQGGC